MPLFWAASVTMSLRYAARDLPAGTIIGTTTVGVLKEIIASVHDHTAASRIRLICRGAALRDGSNTTP